jgi:hypothetical protein
LAGQTLLIQGANLSGAATLTSASGFSNSGTLTMDTLDGAHAVTLSLTTGTLANLPGGVFNVNQGALGIRNFTGNLTNDGEVNLNINTTFNGPNGVFDLDGGTFDQTIGTFSMSGSGGAFNFTGGVIVGNPVINLQNKADSRPTPTTPPSTSQPAPLLT